MSEKKKPFFSPKLLERLQKTLSSFINAIAETITSSVHIPEIAIGPIIGSLISSATTLIIGFLTISNIFSEQFLYRPLQIQDSNANYTLELDSYRQTILTDYLNQTTQLTLNYPVWKLQQNSNLLRATTQATLKEVDGGRKRFIVMFLKDNNLLSFNQSKVTTPLLTNANLQESQLDHLDLSFINLESVNLTKSNLNYANLHQTNLNQAILTQSSLVNTNLTGANLSKTELTNADLTNACYDVFTLFPDNFDPIKAKMRMIDPFGNCDIVILEKEGKKQSLPF